jgi:hypothetical protein
MAIAPVTPTETAPAFPDPNVLLEISPPLAMLKEPAMTVALPAFPVLPGSESARMPVTAAFPSIAS